MRMLPSHLQAEPRDYAGLSQTFPSALQGSLLVVSPFFVFFWADRHRHLGRKAATRVLYAPHPPSSALLATECRHASIRPSQHAFPASQRTVDFSSSKRSYQTDH